MDNRKKNLLDVAKGIRKFLSQCGGFELVEFYMQKELAEDLADMIEEWCKQKSQTVLSNRICESDLPCRYVRKGFCPKCHQEVEWLLNRSYCGFCGQAVKWNE